MIAGAHIIICSKEAEADRAFFREILNFPHVDVGHGWLIFRLPPAELRRGSTNLGMIKLTPSKISSQGTDWRFFNELKRELKS
jgi:hypothetical protein